MSCFVCFVFSINFLMGLSFLLCLCVYIHNNSCRGLVGGRGLVGCGWMGFCWGLVSL